MPVDYSLRPDMAVDLVEDSCTRRVIRNIVGWENCDPALFGMVYKGYTRLPVPELLVDERLVRLISSEVPLIIVERNSDVTS